MYHHRFALLALGIFTLACTTTYTINQPRVLHPCAWAQDGDPQIAAMGALIMAMQDNKWNIIQGSAEHGFVRAEACRRAFCGSVDAYIDRGGGIEIFASPNQELYPNEVEVLEGWLHKLDRRYEIYRCEVPPNHVDLVEGLYMPSESVPPKPVAEGT